MLINVQGKPYACNNERTRGGRLNLTFSFIGIFAVLSVWILRFVFVFRQRLSCMAGMMAAMVLGMTAGLGSGVFLASFLSSGALFQTTMAGMFIGGFTGLLAGLPISLMAVLDGLLSGIMSGMMGAMLAVMIPDAYMDITLKIIATLCGGILFVLFLMLQGEIKEEQLKQHSWILSKPHPMFLAIVVFFAALYPSPTMNIDRQELHQAHPNQNPLAPDNNPRKQQEFVITASEFSFSPSSIRIAADETVKFTLINKGSVEHDFDIAGTGIHLHAAPGETVSGTFTLQQQGKFEAVCTLPGHKEAGMHSAIRVGSV